jgi:Family of unknown function (DUF5996)
MNELWPPLPYPAWKDTYETLHRWTQIAGKVRLARTPLVNHYWNVTFRPTPSGLTSREIPDGAGAFTMDFDFLRHRLSIATSRGDVREIALAPRSVADFYAEVRSALADLEIAVRIWPMPVEISEPVRFDLDREHASYDPEAVERFHRILLSAAHVFERFRAGFVGKSSPVHFFWGSFDLCVTRFSGRRAPERPEADCMTQEAYSHEVASVGFWPGGGPVPEPVFYAYAAPEPEGFPESAVRPSAAYYDPDLKELLLPYEAVRTSDDPERDILAFCQSAYDAAADLGRWDRPALERGPIVRLRLR